MKRHVHSISLLLVLVMAFTMLSVPTSLALEPKVSLPDTIPGPDAKLDEDIVIVQPADMISFDPVNTSELSNAYTLFNIYSRLFGTDETLNAVPELVEEYEMVTDTEWRFKIYEGVKFHDGTELTADDVIHSLLRTQQGTAIGALFAPVDTIAKVDDYTISITTKGLYPALLTALNHQACSIVPKHYAEKAVETNDWSSPIGSGRYKFRSRLIGDSIIFDRFDEYFDQNDKACNKSITLKIIPEASARTIAVETGEADLNIAFDTVGYDRVVADPNLQLWEHDSAMVWHLGYDHTHEWFSNILVRKAINYAVDRAACLEVGHNGHGTVMYNSSTFAPGCLGAIDNPNDLYSYDPDKAIELMKEAGCPGFETTIVVTKDEAERIATVVQAYLDVIGIKAQIKRVEAAVFSSTVQAHEAPMFVTSWGCYWDPDLFLGRRFGQAGIGGVNRGWYLNPEVDALLQEGRSSADNVVRAEVYERVQKLMAEDAVECDLYVNTIFALANKDLKGVELNSEQAYRYWTLHY